jgi:hypothetical protein
LKKVLYILILLIVIAGCKKPGDIPVNELQSVIFSGISNASNGLKIGDQVCDNPKANYAYIEIEGQTFLPAVFYIDGKLFTEAIRLLPGVYSVDDFLLMNDAGTPDDASDDIVVKAVPKAGSVYADFVSNPVSFSINVAQFEKTEVELEVICYDETESELFGFD